jgi:hypothetical protein
VAAGKRASWIENRSRPMITTQARVAAAAPYAHCLSPQEQLELFDLLANLLAKIGDSSTRPPQTPCVLTAKTQQLVITTRTQPVLRCFGGTKFHDHFHIVVLQLLSSNTWYNFFY